MASSKRLAELQAVLHSGLVIPASPLALTSQRKLDERRQRALWRYYSAAGAGGIAIGVHTTQFAIRNPGIDLFRPILELAAEELGKLNDNRLLPLVKIAGACGTTKQASAEAELAAKLGYDAVLLSLGAMRDASEAELVTHCAEIAKRIPLIGFYLQPSVGGRILPYRFWRQFCEIDNIAAIKIAPFNRYQTIDVIRAVAESGRNDIALYTGNDDAIVTDLTTPFTFKIGTEQVHRRICGGLLGHWSVWTSYAVTLLQECRNVSQEGGSLSSKLMETAVHVTDANAAFFDPAHGFVGCIAGLHEVLRRQRLLEGTYCLDPDEGLSPGQMEEIDRVYSAYPHMNDDAFVREHLDDWLR